MVLDLSSMFIDSKLIANGAGGDMEDEKGENSYDRKKTLKFHSSLNKTCNMSETVF